jgi:ABC-type dipeptide/oligopeptide/nickel transport system permease subunit
VSCYGFYWLSIVIGVLAAPKIAKLIIERVEIFWKREFIQATLAMGVPGWKIALVHILRYNCLPVLFLQIGVLCADVVIIQITLDYISENSSWGQNVTVPHNLWPSWGNMLDLARKNLEFWWAYMFPIAVSLVWILTTYGLTYFLNRHLLQQRLKVEY